jgi:3-oxoacyl-[acyl-carrier-protein] synthase-3
MNALADAGMKMTDIDCLVCASATMDQALPYNAAMVLAELESELPKRICSFDVGASCLSFLQALDLVATSITAERYLNVVIVSADISTFTINFNNLRENGIFGDGAAAVVLRRAPQGESSRILAVNSITLPEGVEYCQIRSGGSRFHRRNDNSHADALFEMRGRPLFTLASRHLPRFVEQLLREADLKLSDIDYFVPHQASRQSMDHVARRLGIADGRMVDIFGEFGNQVGASLPTALHYAISRHGMKRGQTALLLGTGAGVCIGGMVIVY